MNFLDPKLKFEENEIRYIMKWEVFVFLAVTFSLSENSE